MSNHENLDILITNSLKRLPESTRHLLQLASCIGHHFDLRTLAIIHQKSAQETASDLSIALEKGLILPTTPIYKYYEQIDKIAEQWTDSLPVNYISLFTYKFSDDRIQKSAYSFISEENQQKIHYQIGEHLLQIIAEDEQQENIFILVHHLTKGLKLITKSREKDKLAQLNLMAGNKAQAMGAYQTSFEYATAGLNLLTENSWQPDYYRTTCHLYRLAAEMADLCGDKVAAMELYDHVIAKAKANGYGEEEGLANELAGQFYLDWGKEKIAIVYLSEAYDCYSHTAQKPQLENLVTSYPQLLQKKQLEETNVHELLNNVGAVITRFKIYSDYSWEYEYHSQGSESLFGYSTTEFMADEFLWLSRVAFEDQQKVILPCFKKALAGESGNIEFQFCHKDESIRWISQSFTSRADRENNCAIVTTVSINITEQKQAQLRLQESENYVRTLFEMATVGLALCDLDGNLVDCNPVYSSIIGYTLEEAQSLSYWEITPQQYVEQEQMMLQSLETTGHYGPYEKEYIHQDGYLVPVRLSGLIIERHGQKFIWSSVEDITDSKQTDKAIKSLLIGTSSVVGKDFFSGLVEQIAYALQVSHVLVAQKAEIHFQTLALWANSQVQETLTYCTSNSPCEQVLLNDQYYCERGVQEEFPDDDDLKLLGAESYQ